MAKGVLNRLPFMLSANPIMYGRFPELSAMGKEMQARQFALSYGPLTV